MITVATTTSITFALVMTTIIAVTTTSITFTLTITMNSRTTTSITIAIDRILANAAPYRIVIALSNKALLN